MPINWLSGTPLPAIEEYLLWRAAIESADAGDTQPLVDLLRTRKKLRPEARASIADLLERHTLANKRGRQATPAYKVTAAEARMDKHARLYRYLL